MIISLIGMTGAGKTTVGKILGKKLGFDFFDSDEIIRRNTQKPPTEIFGLYGEKFFRSIESETLKKILAQNKNIVLACGGGAVLCEKNREMLKQNSFVVWLVRPVEEILKNPEVLYRPPIIGSPLIYMRIFKARKSLYAQTCRLKIGFTDANEAAEKIAKVFT